jgi:hypothetical protein
MTEENIKKLLEVNILIVDFNYKLQALLQSSIELNKLLAGMIDEIQIKTEGLSKN